MHERPVFVTGNYYHVYNRGVAKQPLFHDSQDYRHFLTTLAFYVEALPDRRLSDTDPADVRQIIAGPPTNPLIDIVSYSLMPNHFHLLVQQQADQGISAFMKRAMNSYTRSYNTRYDRIGTVFQGRFSAVAVTSDEQLVHLCRYIHLNATVAKLVSDPADYAWSSHKSYTEQTTSRLSRPQTILGYFGDDVEDYIKFIKDYIGFAQDLALIKRLMIEDE